MLPFALLLALSKHLLPNTCLVYVCVFLVYVLYTVMVSLLQPLHCTQQKYTVKENAVKAIKLCSPSCYKCGTTHIFLPSKIYELEIIHINYHTEMKMFTCHLNLQNLKELMATKNIFFIEGPYGLIWIELMVSYVSVYLMPHSCSIYSTVCR